MATTPAEQKREQTRAFLRQYWSLTRRAGTEVEWIMLKLSCSEAEARRRIALADPTGALRVGPNEQTRCATCRARAFNAPAGSKCECGGIRLADR